MEKERLSRTDWFVLLLICVAMGGVGQGLWIVGRRITTEDTEDTEENAQAAVVDKWQLPNWQLPPSFLDDDEHEEVEVVAAQRDMLLSLVGILSREIDRLERPGNYHGEHRGHRGKHHGEAKEEKRGARIDAGGGG